MAYEVGYQRACGKTTAREAANNDSWKPTPQQPLSVLGDSFPGSLSFARGRWWQDGDREGVVSTPDSWEWAIDGALASSIIMNADPSVGLAYRPAGLPLPVQRPSRPRQRALWPILARLGLIPSIHAERRSGRGQLPHARGASVTPRRYVWADALTMKVREGGRIVNIACLLAVGVTYPAQPSLEAGTGRDDDP